MGCFYGRSFEDLGLGDLLSETKRSFGWFNSDHSREGDALNGSVLVLVYLGHLRDHFLFGW